MKCSVRIGRTWAEARSWWSRSGWPSRLRKAGVAVLGFSVLAAGLALLALPVPGSTLLVVPLGLAILGREFSWARRLLNRFRELGRWLLTLSRRWLRLSVVTASGTP
jgi:tellurite resistance protein TerC